MELKQLSKLFDGLSAQWTRLRQARVSKEFVEYYDYEEEAVCSFFSQRVARLVDVGCGHGRILARLLGKADKLYGLDVSVEMLKQARLTLPDSVSLILHDATQPWPFENSFFNILACTGNALGNMTERRLVLDEAFRCLAPGSKAFFSTYNATLLTEEFARSIYGSLEKPLTFERLDDADKTVYLQNGLFSHWFSRQELASLLEKAGFKAQLRETGIGIIAECVKPQ